MKIRPVFCSEKKRDYSKFFIILCISLSYAFFGFLGDLLTLHATDAATIWPPAGIALASCLIWGRWVWPGVFIGAFIINGWISFDISSLQSVYDSIVLVSIISFGAALQAVVGHILITRSVDLKNYFQSPQKICQFLFWGGGISCLISSSIGVTSLVFANVISFEQYFTNWVVWWLGDSIGVSIFTPLTLVFFAHPRQHWRLKFFSVAMPLVVALLVVVSIFSYVSQQEQKQRAIQFQADSSRLYEKLRSNVNRYQQNLITLSNFFKHSKYITRSEFKGFTKQILLQQNEIQALAWIRYFSASEKQRFEHSIDKEGLVDFLIYDKQGPLTVTALDDQYAVITYIEPYESNKKALGLNVLSDKNVFDTLVKGVKTASITATPGIKLVQDGQNKWGIVIYHPIYSHKLSAETQNVTPYGFVASIFYIESFIHATLSHDEYSIIDFELYDVTSTHQPQLLFSKKTDINPRSNHEQNDLLTFQQALRVADRQWSVRFSSASSYSSKNGAIWFVLSGGFFFTAMFSGFLMALSGRSGFVNQAVEEKTKDLAQLNYVLTKTNQALASSNKKLQDSEYQFRKLVQTQSAIVWRYDLKAECFSFVSDEAENLLGYSNEQWFEQDFWVNHIHEDDRQQAYAYTLSAAQKQQKYEFEYRMITKSNQVVWVKDIVNVVSKNGEANELVGVMIDISLEHEAEEQMRLAATTFETLEGITITDANAIVLKVNHAFTEITGFSEEESVGQHMSFLKSGRQSNAFYQTMWKQLIKTGKFEGEMWNRKKNGEFFPEWITITAVKDDHAVVTHYVGVFSDITAKKASEDEIRSLAFYDPLTKLPNRRLLVDRIQQEILEAKRNQYYGAVIFLDLDRFKILNDSLGHHVGDELLIQVANRLKSVLREGDTASRLGGDEFVVLLPFQEQTANSAADKALNVAEKIRVLLNEAYPLQNSEHTFSSSLGIAIFPADSDNAANILQQADTAMYLSKERGKNCISFYHASMQETADKRLVLENELRIAINKQQLVLFYQPQVNESGLIISAEALIRWQHPEKGLISPADFIPIAEETSLILLIGNWVLDEACRQIKEWQLSDLSLKYIAINVSSRQFKQPDFIHLVSTAIDKHGISAECLTLELTESIVADDIKDTAQKMSALKALGIKISIDDFGTGYSSLSYLTQLPLDDLKIDQSFVRSINVTPEGEAIVETIINMANSLGLNVIAEGVETEEQAKFLQQKGCKTYQGYYYGRPKAVSEFIIEAKSKSHLKK